MHFPKLENSTKFIDFFKRFGPFLVLIFLALIFFFVVSSYNQSTQSPDYVKWGSPDESANYFFARQYAITGNLSYFDPASFISEDIVRPRSFRSDFGWLKPVSFLGIMVIYGHLADLTSISLIPYFTPFFAALGILVFYLLIKEIFPRRVAFWSAVLLAAFPVYDYFSARSMFHNVPFLVAVMISFYFLVLALRWSSNRERRRFRERPGKLTVLSSLAYGGAGIFGGLAVALRTSELLWLLPVWLLIWLFYLRRINFSGLFFFLVGLFLAIAPFAHLNFVLYGSPFYGGYNEMNRSLQTLSSAGSSLISPEQISSWPAFWQRVSRAVFYFGFNLHQSVKMFYYYFVVMFPWLFVLAGAGIVFVFSSFSYRFKRKELVYLLTLFIVGAILIFYYGSWQFNDNPDPRRFTIGNSYTRYWLPLYAMCLPLAVLAIFKIIAFLTRDRRLSRELMGRVDSESSRPSVYNRLSRLASGSFSLLIITTIFFSSILFTLFGSEEGLVLSSRVFNYDRGKNQEVLALTDPQGVIITRYHDKAFFPERRVVVGYLTDDYICRLGSRLAKQYPLYYYSFTFPDRDFQYLKNKRMPDCGMQFEKIKTIDHSFTLYRLSPLVASSTVPVKAKKNVKK